ncbi:MAG: phytanoyl-CoA dioxygenase family protein [Chloroflexi bacterium]|nr:phytanoyl-CoA dioxygenase family protein [Chloroflexota bacterium]
MSELQRKQLEEEGYILLPGALSQDQVLALITQLEELWLAEGDRAGQEVIIEPGARRLANLVNNGEVFRPVFTEPIILEAAKVVLGPEIRLGSLNARSVPPHSDPKMPLHCDTDYTGKPDKSGFYSFSCIWMLDDFTCQNGATHIVPGTHRSNVLPKEALADVYAPHPQEVVVEGNAGDVLVFNGHCWHTGGANVTDGQRRAILGHYNRADHPQQTNQRKLLSPQVKAGLTPLERQILGLDDSLLSRASMRVKVLIWGLRWQLTQHK